MLLLTNFLNDIQEIITAQDVPDVLDFVPHFEKFNLSNWKELLNYNNGQPETTVLYESQAVKLMLIYWNKHQESSIHGHPGGGGLIKVLHGSLEETRLDPLELEEVIDTHIVQPGSISYIHDMLAFHKVRNPKNTPAVSLHIYRK